MTKQTAKGAVELTPRQSRFVDEYLVDLNATQAAARAGYKDPNIGRRLVTKSHVAAAIEQRMANRSQRTSIDADYVLHRLVEIDQLDVADILDEAGNMLPVRQWPKAWRTSITGIDMQEMMAGDVMSVIRKIKWPDKLKNIELLGKHVSVKAFEDAKGDNEDLPAPVQVVFKVQDASDPERNRGGAE